MSGSAGGGASGDVGGAVGATEEKKKKATLTSASVGLLRNGVSHLRGTAKDYVPSVVAHPAVERLALNYARGKTKGARERVSALLRVLRVVVENFEAPADATYALSLTHHLNQVVHTLDKARPMGIAMGNAVRSLKTHLARLSRDENQGLCNDGCKQKTLMHIDYFIKEKLDGALESIVRAGVTNIVDGDVVVTHGASHAVREILLRAHEAGVKFTVTVVDSRPSSEGAGILSDLCAHGIDCVFTALNGLSYAMRHATKVLIGAAACLSNGVVVSRIGSSAVAHAALEQGVPVFVAAETCKFHERVQFDAFAFNEIGACGEHLARRRRRRSPRLCGQFAEPLHHQPHLRRRPGKVRAVDHMRSRRRSRRRTCRATRSRTDFTNKPTVGRRAHRRIAIEFHSIPIQSFRSDASRAG